MAVNFVAPAEIAAAMGITTRAVNKRAKRDGWPAEIFNKRGDKRFRVSDLPEDVKIALAGRNPVGQGINIGIARTMPKTPITERIVVGSPDLTDKQNRIALARADLVRAYLKDKEQARKAGRSKVEAGKSFVRAFNTGNLIPQLYNILGPTSWRTIERWVADFRRADYDYAALAPRHGNRKGQRKVTDDEFNTMLSFALHPNRLRVAEVTRHTKRALKQRGVPSPSSQDTLRRALEDWKKCNYDQWIFCREGEKALNDVCLPYLERDVGLLEVGDVFVADGHTLNFQVLHPFTGKPARMILVLWYDWASCMPVGWEVMPTENVQCVAAALRRAILTLGKMPKVAYLDNGKAFKAKIFTDTDIDFEAAGFFGMFARLGIETIFAWPYHAQSKPVERFFGSFQELERLMPTFTGASIQDKPAHILRNEKLHKKIHEKRYGGWVPSIHEADKIISGWVVDYMERPHRGLKGLCPGEVFKAGQGPGVDEPALRFLMMDIQVKTIHRNGIRFLGRNYYDPALYGYRDRVMIRYDMEDLSKIFVYDVTGAKLICEAEAMSPVHPVAKLTGRKEDLAAVKEGIRQKRALKRATERGARAYIEDAPKLVEIPERIAHSAQGTAKKKRQPLPKAEAERIEAEAAKMKVVEIQPQKPEPLYMTEADRYEQLLEREFKGEELGLDDMRFMRYFETTDFFTELKDRFEFLKEVWLGEMGELSN